jgi:hypothetical protein
MAAAHWALPALLLLRCGGAAPSAGQTPLAPTPAPAALGNTGYITQPPVVSAGMGGLVASVPVQPGTSWNWTLTGGTSPGPRQNAALTFTAGTGASLQTRCEVTQGGQTTTYFQDTFVVPPLIPVGAHYGPGLNADALANTQVGGPGGNAVSQRFRAGSSGPLLSVRVFLIWDLHKPGYCAGTGGTVRVDLLADDGSASHLPAGPPLASATYGNILASDFYPLLTFAQPATLAAGALYHLRFTNVDPDPVANYVSVDSLYTDAQTAPIQPVASDLDAAVLLRQGSSPWQVRPGFTPVAEYRLATGSQGQGYMEVWSGNAKAISGQAMVRERFTVSGPSFTTSRVMVRLRRDAGASALTLRMELGDGTTLMTCAQPAASALLGASSWVTFPLPAPLTLATGGTYHLALECPGDTRYSAFPYRKGTDKGFSGATLFLDGYAQFTTTGPGGWAGWDQWGQPDRRDGDLQFLFLP